MKSGKLLKICSLRAAAALSVFCIVFLSACSASRDNPGNIRGQYFPEEYQVKNHADERISAFGLNIAPADEMGDWVVDWLSGVTAGDGFQYFIYSDPDSWDVYIYYPERQEEIKGLVNDDVSVEYSDGILSVYVTTCREDGGLTDSGPAGGGENWILHFAAYPFGTWPSKIKLYWDDCEILCEQVQVSVHNRESKNIQEGYYV